MRNMLLTLVGAVLLALALLASTNIGGDTGEAVHEGSLLLDFEIDDNTPTSVGEVRNQLCKVEAQGQAQTISVDVIAQGAVDWASAAYIVNFPAGAEVTEPGPDLFDSGFDFDPVNDFAQNFLNPGTQVTDPDHVFFGLVTDVSGTQAVPDNDGAHGISWIDDDAPADTFTEGTLARIKLKIGGLEPGTHTLSISLDGVFPGVIDSSGVPVGGLAFPFDLDPVALGSATLTLESACPELRPDLTVSKTDDPDPVESSSPLTYDITVSNIDPFETATGVVVRDTLPAGSTIQTLPANCTETAPLVVDCNLGDIGPLGQTTVPITVLSPSAATGEVVLITNTAVVDPDDTVVESDEGNNSFTEVTELLGPPPGCGDELVCTLLNTIDDSDFSDITILPTSDDCAVNEFCKTLFEVNVDRVGGTPPAQPGDRLSPAIRLTSPPAFQIPTDDEIVDGSLMGQLVAQIRTDAGFLLECTADLTLVFNLLDGHINDDDPLTPDTDSSEAALVSPFVWPSLLDEFRADVEADTPGTETLIARYVGFDVVGGTVIPFNLLFWQLDPTVQFIEGEPPGGLLSVSVTGDPADPIISPVFCTPFSSTTVILGRTTDGRSLLRCREAGVHTVEMVVDALVLRPSPKQELTDTVNCSAHDVRVSSIGRRSPRVAISSGRNRGTVERTISVKVENQSDHTETMKLLVVVATPSGCSASGPGPEGVFSDTRTYGTKGKTKGNTFKFDVTFTCVQPFPIDQAFILKATVDHRADDSPLPDNDDIDPLDNAQIKSLIVK